jgi:hypothetical protein
LEGLRVGFSSEYGVDRNESGPGLGDDVVEPHIAAFVLAVGEDDNDSPCRRIVLLFERVVESLIEFRLFASRLRLFQCGLELVSRLLEGGLEPVLVGKEGESELILRARRFQELRERALDIVQRRAPHRAAHVDEKHEIQSLILRLPGGGDLAVVDEKAEVRRFGCCAGWEFDDGGEFAGGIDEGGSDTEHLGLRRHHGHRRHESETDGHQEYEPRHGITSWKGSPWSRS